MHDKQDTFVRHVEFSAATRILHWVRAICIVVLVVTGFYIGYPFLAPAQNAEPTGFLYALVRSWHQIFGFVLIAASIVRVYLFITSKGSEFERRSWKDAFNISIWIAIIKTYFLIGAHPKQQGAYNPLQLFTYVAVMLLIFVMSLTGLVLYMNVYHEGLGGMLSFLKPIEAAFGGLSHVRLIHHYTTWAFIVFLPMHIYLATWNSVRYPGGGIDTIASGYRYEKR